MIHVFDLILTTSEQLFSLLNVFFCVILNCIPCGCWSSQQTQSNVAKKEEEGDIDGACETVLLFLITAALIRALAVVRIELALEVQICALLTHNRLSVKGKRPRPHSLGNTVNNIVLCWTH